MSEQTAIPNLTSEVRPPISDLRYPTSNVRRPILTVEIGLYGIIVALALAVRLYRLGQAPLSTSEAQLALAAWRGTTPPIVSSPLLYWVNALLFAILGSSDGLARLVPALVGSALVTLPAFWRERVGRTGALGAAAFLAISPIAIMTSRTSSGEVIVAAAMVGLVAAVDRYLQTGSATWLYAGAATLGLGLASGASIYSALLVLLVGAGLGALGPAGKAGERWHALHETPGLIGRVIGAMAAAFAVSATALMWRPGGLGAAIDLFSVWLAGFRSQAGATLWYWPFQLLVVYEPLALVVGVIGLFLAIQRAQRFVGLLVVWLVAATLLAVIRPARTSGDVLLVVIPLAMLGGYALEPLADSLRAMRFSVEEGVLIMVVLPVVAYFALGLTAYINNPTAILPIGGRLDLGPVAQVMPMFLAMLLIGILIALFAALANAEVAMRGAIITALIVLAMVTWAAGWGAAQNRPGDPRELITGPETTSPAVRDLARDLTVLSSSKTTDPRTLSFVVQSPPDGVLGWYLRDMSNAQFMTALDASSAPPVLVTTDSKPPALSGSYAGQRFTLQHEWRIEDKPPNDVLKWLVYRKAELPKPTQQAILWVQQEQQP
jgi:uncharacterized protein (TIGR03663 family)